ncbi:large-conductance mechanosensitive channel protein MscL [Aureitalea marina]|uniref:Large-conductance mechanosensitive channel n=1 Tax=Aureitalea marina TaxID=930804 RepID=A0A2S7KPD6_9FLAO|nr:large-conductance mechanosensitive channel protein MscL [Aureitalea marina]PQB04467.1 mechanosensitive ion channel protein MscL [Aureitalea marina]
MKQFFNEFKEFAIKGNVVDMAIGIVIGTAFNKVVSVLVKNIISPPLMILTSQLNYEDQKIVLKEATESYGEIAIGYGVFVEAVVDFIIIALAIFLVIKFMNRIRNKAEDPTDVEVKTPKEIELLSRIEALMEEQNKILQQGQKSS